MNSGAAGVLAESLNRIEHKLDLLLEMVVQLAGPGKRADYTLMPVGDLNHVCPICTKPVHYLIDVFNRLVARKCDCATGKVSSFDLSTLGPSVSTRTEGASYGTREEDRDDSLTGK